jgi:hypothetical protein
LRIRLSILLSNSQSAAGLHLSKGKTHET